MSQPSSVSEPQFAVLNHCQPCQNSTGRLALARASMDVARVVAPPLPSNSYTAHLHNVLVHVNALNAGESELAHPKAYLTGYTAGMARY